VAHLTYPSGWRPIQTAGVTTPVAIAASTALTLPTSIQRLKSGTLMCILNVETANARWTTNGVVPTAAIGMLLQVNTPLTLMGENDCSAFLIISATGVITYQFYEADNR
jgi:hypothetical protein